MTKISKQAAAKFLAGDSFKSGNIAVRVDEHGQVAELVLHCNVIARRNTASRAFDITTAGWNTKTTKSFLNALPGVRVTTANFKLSLNGQPWDGAWKTIDPV